MTARTPSPTTARAPCPPAPRPVPSRWRRPPRRPFPPGPRRGPGPRDGAGRRAAAAVAATAGTACWPASAEPQAAGPAGGAAAGQRRPARGSGRGARAQAAVHAAQAAQAVPHRADGRAHPRWPGRPGHARAARPCPGRHRQRRGDQDVPRDRARVADRAGHRDRRLGGQHRGDHGHRAQRRAAAVRAADQDLRATAAARARLLRTGTVRPDHDPDDDRRGRAVLVPADRPGHRGQLGLVVLRRAGGPPRDQPQAGPDRTVDHPAARRRDLDLPGQVVEGVQRGQGEGQRGQCRPAGERGRAAGDPGLPP